MLCDFQSDIFAETIVLTCAFLSFIIICMSFIFILKREFRGDVCTVVPLPTGQLTCTCQQVVLYLLEDQKTSQQAALYLLRRLTPLVAGRCHPCTCRAESRRGSCCYSPRSLPSPPCLQSSSQSRRPPPTAATAIFYFAWGQSTCSVISFVVWAAKRCLLTHFC